MHFLYPWISQMDFWMFITPKKERTMAEDPLWVKMIFMTYIVINSYPSNIINKYIIKDL